MTIYSKFGFAFKGKAFPKGIKRVCGFSFLGVSQILLWEYISRRLAVELWLTENCSVSMSGAETVPEEFFLAPYPPPFYFPYDGQVRGFEVVFPQTPSLG